MPQQVVDPAAMVARDASSHFPVDRLQASSVTYKSPRNLQQCPGDRRIVYGR
jgi:hypothetical protein